MCIELIPREIWEKIFLSIPSLRDLLHTADTCREFRLLIRNERFLQKYFQKSTAVKLTKDLSVLCNFTSEIAQSRSLDYLYNSIDSNPDQPTTKINAVNHPKIESVDLRPCLIFANGGRSTYIEKQCKFDGKDSFSISFWFLLRNFITNNQLPLMFIFGHGEKHYLSLYFVVSPSGQLNSLFDFAHRRQDDSITAEQLQTNKWYHIVALFSMKDQQSTIQFYINGKKTSEVVIASVCVDANGSVLVRSQFEDGYLADIALWSRELLPIEINLLWNQHHTTVDKIDMAKSILMTLT